MHEPAYGGHGVPSRLQGRPSARRCSCHKSITTTADTYMHLDRDDLEEAMKLAYVRWQQLSEEDE